MNDFLREILGALKTQLAELNSFSRLVVHKLLPYCDDQTGTILIDTVARGNSYVALSFHRKKEVINSDTLRNILRSIKKDKSDHFVHQSHKFMHRKKSNTLTSQAMDADHGRTKNS